MTHVDHDEQYTLPTHGNTLGSVYDMYSTCFHCPFICIGLYTHVSHRLGIVRKSIFRRGRLNSIKSRIHPFPLQFLSRIIIPHHMTELHSLVGLISSVLTHTVSSGTLRNSCFHSWDDDRSNSRKHIRHTNFIVILQQPTHVDYAPSLVSLSRHIW